MDNNLSNYEVNSFDGRISILSTEIIQNIIRISCYEKSMSNPIMYTGEFSLDFLRRCNLLFNSTLTIKDALDLINYAIESENIGIYYNLNNINISLSFPNQNISLNLGNNNCTDISYLTPITLPTKKIYITYPTIIRTNPNDNCQNSYNPAINNSTPYLRNPINSNLISYNSFEKELRIKQLENELDILKNKKDILRLETSSILFKIEFLKDKIERLSQENFNLKQNQKKDRKDLEIFRLNQKLDNLSDEIRKLNINLIIQQPLSHRLQKSQNIYKDTIFLARGDILKNNDEIALLANRISNYNSKIGLSLIYKATEESDSAAIFHQNGDMAKCSIVLIRSGNGKRFGGYTSCSWKGNNIIKKDEKAFVFSLDKMITYGIIPGEDAIGCFPELGPIFLGCQIKILDKFLTNGGFTCEKGKNYKTNEDFELTGGLEQFEVEEIEVYNVDLY